MKCRFTMFLLLGCASRFELVPLAAHARVDNAVLTKPTRTTNCTAPHHIAPHRTASHRTASHRIAPVRTAPHRTAPHRIAPHRTAPHRTGPHRTRSANRCGMNVSVLKRNDAIKAFFPFHDDEPRDALFAKWVKRSIHPIDQPLDDIKVQTVLLLFLLLAVVVLAVLVDYFSAVVLDVDWLRLRFSGICCIHDMAQDLINRANDED